MHVGQFAGMAILLAGLLALFFALDVQAGTARWAGRFGAASAVVTLALYGVLQAVDGVALKQAVNAWASAPDAEKAARFASAEAIRWLEWGVRSYQNFALGLALLLFAAAVVRTAWVPRPIAYLMGLSGLTYLVQGWVAGSEGFSQTETIAIVLAEVLNVAWMIWLVVVAWRMQDSEPRRLADEDLETSPSHRGAGSARLCVGLIYSAPPRRNRTALPLQHHRLLPGHDRAACDRFLPAPNIFAGTPASRSSLHNRCACAVVSG